MQPARRALVRAPSNIALIKYMGKDDAESNLPANASLSLTLSSLCTYAEARRDADREGVAWEPATPEGAEAHAAAHGARAPKVPDLSQAGQARMLRHVERVRAAAPQLLAAARLPCETRGLIAIRAANTFPAAAGIASSASSFAAVTLATTLACCPDRDAFVAKYLAGDRALRRALASLSRRGSGSSCRSFEGPWVLWEKEHAARLETPEMPALVDFVLVIGASPKEISSTEAHRLVTTSPLWDGRADRVADRMKDLEAGLGEGDLERVSRVAWSETWEMHSLFHTCADPFTYWVPGTLEALRWLARRRKEETVIVTMDAGANVHVLVPQADAARWRSELKSVFPRFELLEDAQGTGAEVLE